MKCILFSFLSIVLFGAQFSFAAGTWISGDATAAGQTRNYKLWVPDGYQSGVSLPLVMMLHGCSQNPDDFAAGTQMVQFVNLPGDYEEADFVGKPRIK